MYRKDFQKLATERLSDARILFDGGRFDAAYYLAGYAVECALKACIAKRSRHHQFPVSPEIARDIYTHDFNRLLKAAGLTRSVEATKEADSKLKVNWDGIVKDWNPKSRYDRNGTRVGKKKAEDMINAVADPDHGVLQCLRTDW